MTPSAPSLVVTERHGLADDLERLGPDAPTVLPGWQAQDLLEHLIIREQRPDLGIGANLPVPALSERAERALEERRSAPWSEQVEAFRSGPQRFSPVRPMDAVMNTGEYYVHHEDLLRAQPEWEPRELDGAAERELWGLVRRMSRMLLRLPVDITLVSPQGGTRIRTRRSEGSVQVHGPASELLLWAFGRDQAQVRLEGSEDALAALADGNRGF
ncbi:MAG: TIGR03085 family metal-binding protein [Brachybacterium sp.]|nr:TIGR03085 family metal-binding protein [Brachybacterium sp.]